jgi:1-acyl-sn-glycerol-3-phosphate acyltransferase
LGAVDPVYRLLRAIVRVALELCYARVEVHGLEPLRERGPLLLLANHPNGLVDPMLVIATSPRAVRFISKATLFPIPVLGFFLRRLGCLPARRRQDPGWEPGANEELFRIVGAALGEGGVVGLFPEGTTHLGPALVEFRHGAARMALEAEAGRGFTLGLGVMLVGIHFERSRGWRGRALVHYAPPLGIAGWRERWERDPRAATAELTRELQERLAALVLSVESAELAELAELVERFGVLEGGAGDMRGRLERRKLLLAGYSRLKETHFAEVEALRERLARYRARLAMLGVSDGVVASELSPGRALGFALRSGLALALGFLPWLAGVLLHVAPFAFSRGVARLATNDPIERVTIGLLVAIFAFPLWYAALLALGWGRLPPLALALLVALGPFLGLAAARWTEGLRRLARATQGAWLALRAPSLRRRLRAERAALLAELERLVALVASAQLEGPRPSEGTAAPSK